MEWGFTTVESYIFLIVEVAILVAVVWEGVISWKTHHISKQQFDHTVNKYKRYKNKPLGDKIREL